MLSFNDKAVSFTQSSSSSGYEVQRKLSRGRNRLLNCLDMEMGMCDQCGTFFSAKLKMMPCPKCGSYAISGHSYNSHSIRHFDNIRLGSVTYQMAA